MSEASPAPATPNMHTLPLVLTIEEAARVLRISRGCAYEAARCGEIPTIRVGRTIRVPKSRLLAMLGEVETMEAEGTSALVPDDTSAPDPISPTHGSIGSGRPRRRGARH